MQCYIVIVNPDSLKPYQVIIYYFRPCYRHYLF